MTSFGHIAIPLQPEQTDSSPITTCTDEKEKVEHVEGSKEEVKKQKADKKKAYKKRNKNKAKVNFNECASDKNDGNQEDVAIDIGTMVKLKETVPEWSNIRK